MSDFDKEAEREKLREKFARDDEKRKHTSRMSELLLKGATMTNKHHDCGSPIFRWEGEEFCPTCHGSPGAAQQVQSAEESQSQQSESADTGTAPGSPADDESAAVEVETPENGATPAADPAPAVEPESEPERAPEPEPAREPTAPAPEPERKPRPSTGTADSVATARASLERTLAAVARTAETTDDLSRKRDYLAAAKEAAEALEAVRRAERGRRD